jgi:hypothetical protein
MIRGFSVRSFGPALLGSLVVTIITFIAQRL